MTRSVSTTPVIYVSETNLNMHTAMKSPIYTQTSEVDEFTVRSGLDYSPYLNPQYLYRSSDTRKAKWLLQVSLPWQIARQATKTNVAMTTALDSSYLTFLPSIFLGYMYGCGSNKRSGPKWRFSVSSSQSLAHSIFTLSSRFPEYSVDVYLLLQITSDIFYSYFGIEKGHVQLIQDIHNI